MQIRRTDIVGSILVTLSIVLIYLALIGQAGSASYCDRCGMIRMQHGWALLDKPIGRWDSSYLDTAYSYLYSHNVPARCPHEWRVWSRTEGGFLGGISCGLYPDPLLHDSRIRALAGLHDRSRVRMLLTHYRLKRGSNDPVNRAEEQAFTELSRVHSAADEDAWWNRNWPRIQAAENRE